MLVFSLFLLTSCAHAQLTPQGELQGPVPVLRVVDGDTIEIPVNGSGESARLIGVDTPETRHPTVGIEPYGPEASAFTKMLLEGREVYIEFDVEERDHYGRPLIYAYFEDPAGDWHYGELRLKQVNLEIARAGLADVLTIPPNVRYSDLYLQAVQEARAAGRGMWGEGSAALSTPPPSEEDRDCSDFSSQAEAQAFFESAGPGDPHGLDSDGDGEVCESLP